VEEVSAPALAGAGNIGQLVDRSGREENPSRCHGAASGEAEREASRNLDHPVVDDLDAVPQDLCAGRCEELGGRHAIARQKALHVGGGCVAGLSSVDDGDSTSRPAEHQSCAQAGSSAADDHNVIDLFFHFDTSKFRVCLHHGRERSTWRGKLPFPGNDG
jgi:hypothetical protein